MIPTRLQPGRTIVATLFVIAALATAMTARTAWRDRQRQLIVRGEFKGCTITGMPFVAGTVAGTLFTWWIFLGREARGANHSVRR